MAAKTAKSKKNTKPVKPEPVEEELDDAAVEEELDEEFDEVEEDEVVETPPAKTAKKKSSTNSRAEVAFGVKSICTLIGEKTGTEPTTRELRILIRRLARDQNNQRVQREIVAGNRTPYSWTGPNDPEVKAIVRAWMAGEQLIEKAEKLTALKERGEKTKAAQPTKAPVGPAAKKSTKPKTKVTKPPVVEEDDEDLDFDEDED